MIVVAGRTGLYGGRRGWRIILLCLAFIVQISADIGMALYRGPDTAHFACRVQYCGTAHDITAPCRARRLKSSARENAVYSRRTLSFVVRVVACVVCAVSCIWLYFSLRLPLFFNIYSRCTCHAHVDNMRVVVRATDTTALALFVVAWAAYAQLHGAAWRMHVFVAQRVLPPPPAPTLPPTYTTYPTLPYPSFLLPHHSIPPSLPQLTAYLFYLLPTSLKLVLSRLSHMPNLFRRRPWHLEGWRRRKGWWHSVCLLPRSRQALFPADSNSS